MSRKTPQRAAARYLQLANHPDETKQRRAMAMAQDYEGRKVKTEGDFDKYLDHVDSMSSKYAFR